MHTHHHDHGPHHDHNHAPAVTASNETLVFRTMLLTGGFMIIEAAGGFLSGSLALIADAGHMLTDTAALALSWLAFYMARKPTDPRRSYGYHRFQILAAFTNGIALFAVVIWIVAEAINRLMTPVSVQGIPMMVIAMTGLAVNVAGFWLLSRGEKENLNMRGAALHVLGDLLGSVAAIAAAAVILMTGWTPIDPILSVLVALLIVRSAWTIVSQSAHILLEGAPSGIDAARIGAALGDIEGVLDIHHVHAWSLTDERPIVTLHAVLREDADNNTALIEINRRLKEHFGIEHATVQIERRGMGCECAP